MSPPGTGPTGDKVVVFGTGSLAQLLHLYLSEDSDHEVVAFTASAELIVSDSFSGLPVVSFDEVSERYPPSAHAMFVAVGYNRMNRVRSHFYGQAKAKGYRLVSYVSSRANVRAAVIGDNCAVFDGATLEPFATLGNDVIVWCGAHVSHHSTVGDHTFLAPAATIAGHTSVGRHCFLGVNATVRDGLTIADDCLIGAGANILRDTAPGQVLAGPRARPSPAGVAPFLGGTPGQGEKPR